MQLALRIEFLDDLGRLLLLVLLIALLGLDATCLSSGGFRVEASLFQLLLLLALLANLAVNIILATPLTLATIT